MLATTDDLLWVLRGRRRRHLHRSYSPSASHPASGHHEVDAEVQRLVGLGVTVIRKHDEAWGP